MTAEAILAIITAMVQAVPELLALFTQLKGSTANATDVQAIIAKYGVDQAVFTAAIEASKAKGK